MNNQKQFSSFFSKYSLLDNYGFLGGLFKRVAQKIIPEYLSENSVERNIHHWQDEFDSLIPMEKFMRMVDENSHSLKNDLNRSLISLSSKIIAFGLDKNIKDKLQLLGLDVQLFLKLNKQIAQIETLDDNEVLGLIDEILLLIKAFRKGKSKIGTSIQLSYKTNLVRRYLERLALLVELKFNIKDQIVWEKIIKDYSEEYKKHRSLRFYFKYHFDLLLLQIVEHTAYKGEKYVASNRTENRVMLRKSMKAGLVISIFACLKLMLDPLSMSNVRSAFVFGLNYAICFVIVKEIGGIIATKQPAMTASTIARKIDKDNDLKIDSTSNVIALIRDVYRTQASSFFGNLIIAIPCSFLITYSLDKFGFTLIAENKISSLEQAIAPSNWKNIYYAAIAGVFLSFSGLVAGFVDNRVRFSKFQKRLENTKLIKTLFSETKTKRLSAIIAKSLGSHIGNISLGLLLGAAFLVETYFGLPFDIRHIAFSGSYLGGLLSTSSLSLSGFLFLFLGVGLIGFVNFISSFSITLFLTFKTRGITLKDFLKITTKLFVDVVSNPLAYFIFKKGKAIV